MASRPAAEDRAEELAQQIETSGLPATIGGGDDDEAPDIILQVTDASGEVVLTSVTLSEPLPTLEGELVPAGGDQRYVVETDEAGDDYVVSVAASLEDVDESTQALVPLLVVGLPLVLLVVGGTTWVVVGRALRPVERIRSEVAAIGDQGLGRRVPVPGGRDELHRLALTMNEMLERLQTPRDRQRRFVSDASHELRSPLASLRQTAEVAQAHPGALPEGELADAVLEESLRMQRIVEQMLVLTRTDEGGLRERRELDLDDIALAEAARVRRDGLTVDVSGVGAARVVGDAVALSQVVRNLVDNAARHAKSRIALHLSGSDGWVSCAPTTTGPAYRRRSGSASSNGSSGSTRLGRATTAVPASAWQSCARSWPRTGVRRGRLSRLSGAPPSSCGCPDEGAFRRVQVAFSVALAVWVATGEPDLKEKHMTGKLHSKRFVIPTVAAAALLGASGIVWANSASAGPSDSEIDRASAAALAEVGEGKVTDTEKGDEEGAYEIEVTLDDGTEIDVHVDESFKVIGQETEAGDEENEADEADEADGGRVGRVGRQLTAGAPFHEPRLTRRGSCCCMDPCNR